MKARSSHLALPRPARLNHTLIVGGFQFTPVPASFVPKSSPQAAWAGFIKPYEIHASYHLYLARISDPTAERAHANAPFADQDVWLAEVQHDASVFTGPVPPPARKFKASCTFGSGFTVISATTGKGVVGGAG
jgi:hypothetical protein